MILREETNLKAEILTRGIIFSNAAIEKSIFEQAKGQNLVYNTPMKSQKDRPQELFLTSLLDQYTTVVSCVAPSSINEAVELDVDENDNLYCKIGNSMISTNVKIQFVPEPKYYKYRLKNGTFAKKYISACGYDELNIIPWKGCFISSLCRFCGVNNVAKQEENDMLHAINISKCDDLWEKEKENYISSLKECIEVALEDDCYQEHMHVIMISGNLSDDLLDRQSEIYAEIAKEIHPLIKTKSTEGIVAVISPPHDLKKIDILKTAGIDIVVYNLEVANDPWFTKYCPGKSNLGRNYFIERLKYSVDIFGKGKVWSNFVLGLEPIELLLNVCEELAQFGIVSGANILHLDEGNRLDCKTPSKENVISFYYQLSQIYKKYNFNPFYCSKALRTSLANELFEYRYI